METKYLVGKYSILNGAIFFSSDRLHNYLLFISTRPIFWISKDGSKSKIESWNSTIMSDQSIKNPHTSYISFASNMIKDYQFWKVEFKGTCLKQHSVSFLHKNVVKLYIFYELDTW